MAENRTVTAEGVGLGLSGVRSPWRTVGRVLSGIGIRGQPSRVQSLKRCAVFSGLSSVELEKVAELAGARQYEAGDVVFHWGDRADEVFILEDGRVAMQMVSSTPPQRAVTVDMACPGELLGWTSLLETHVHDLTATCLQGSKVLALDADRLRVLLREDGIGSKVMEGLALSVMSRLNDTRRLLVAERYWPARAD